MNNDITGDNFVTQNKNFKVTDNMQMDVEDLDRGF